MNIHCGIAGWSYRDWEGWVYPGDVREKLRYVAPWHIAFLVRLLRIFGI